MVDSQISDIIPMAKVVKERFRAATNCVFYFEGYQIPGNLEDYGQPGDIFAFRGIGNNEIERRLFVKAYPTTRRTCTWEDIEVDTRHQKKWGHRLTLNRGFPCWPIWFASGRGHSPLSSESFSEHFDFFFRYHANPQPKLGKGSKEE